jgi:hypothetical protein
MAIPGISRRLTGCSTGKFRRRAMIATTII